MDPERTEFLHRINHGQRGTLVLAAEENNIASSATVTVGCGRYSGCHRHDGVHLESGQTVTGGGNDCRRPSPLAAAPCWLREAAPGTSHLADGLHSADGSTSNFEINGLTSGLYDVVQDGVSAELVAFGGVLNLVFQTDFGHHWNHQDL